MINKLTLTNDQGITLYNFLQEKKLDRARNRIRWKFLDVIEENVFAYELKRDDLINQAGEIRQESAFLQGDQKASFEDKIAKQKSSVELIKKIQEDLKALGKEVNTFEFNDREVFSQGKSIFELSIGENSEAEKLTGQQSKLIKEIEDAFMIVQEVADAVKSPVSATPVVEPKGAN